MAEIKTIVNSYRVDYQCDWCKTGILLSTGLSAPSMIPGEPNKYQHKCTKCEDVKGLATIYPYVAYANADGSNNQGDDEDGS